MVKVEFLGPMSEFESISVNASNLQELKEILSQKPDMQKWLSISAVAVNDCIVDDISFKLKSGDKVMLLPPVCGG